MYALQKCIFAKNKKSLSKIYEQKCIWCVHFTVSNVTNAFGVFLQSKKTKRTFSKGKCSARKSKGTLKTQHFCKIILKFKPS